MTTATALTYPGTTYPFPWTITDGEMRRTDVATVRDTGGAMGRRVPILAYGALASPCRILARLGDLAENLACLPAGMTGVARAWTHAAAAPGREVPPFTLVERAGHVEDAHVLLVPESAIPILDLIEGRSKFYVAARLTGATVVIPGVGEWTSPLTYLGVPPHRGCAHDSEGGPLLVSEYPGGPPVFLDGLPEVYPDAEAVGWQWCPPCEPLETGVPLADVITDEDRALFGAMLGGQR